MQLSLSEIKSRLEFRHPTEEELKAINQFRPNGSEPYTAEEVYHVPFLASTNLLHFSLATWSPSALETMVATYQGKDLQLDHSPSSAHTMGFIYDTELFYTPHLTEESIIKVTAESPNPSIDREILRKDGLYQVICYACVEASHPITSEIRFRRKADVSIGGRFYGEYFCPLCEISFGDRACSHYPPNSWEAWDATPEDIAPYYVRKGSVVSQELSFVDEGNCVQAEIFSQSLNTFALI